MKGSKIKLSKLFYFSQVSLGFARRRDCWEEGMEGGGGRATEKHCLSREPSQREKGFSENGAGAARQAREARFIYMQSHTRHWMLGNPMEVSHVVPCWFLWKSEQSGSEGESPWRYLSSPTPFSPLRKLDRQFGQCYEKSGGLFGAMLPKELSLRHPLHVWPTNFTREAERKKEIGLLLQVLAQFGTAHVWASEILSGF